MMFRKIVVLTLMLMTCYPIWADTLQLSDTEVQKLRHYFPHDEENTYLVWDGNPITIELPLNKEKRLIFPEHVTPDLRNLLTSDEITVINNNKSVYLTALKPFSSTRIYIKLQDTNEVILMNLLTNGRADNNTVSIDVRQNNHNESSTSSFSTHTADFSEPTSDSDVYISLMRFAWQQLYTPERLLNNPLGIVRAPMHTDSMLSTLIYGDKVYAHPVASWTYKDMYVTAVELRNKYPHATYININKDVCGSWRAVAIYPHHDLKPAGDKSGDSTVLFLISKNPFGDSMEVCNGNA